MAWEYSDKTKKLFMDALSKKETTHIGEIKDPDGEGFNGSIVCGDAIKFTFKVKMDLKNPENDLITEAKYLTFGCTSAIAASEALCLIIENNYTPIKALKITKNDIVDFLEGLPTEKIHCSIMGVEALMDAISNWAKKRNVDLSKYGFTKSKHEKEESEDNRIVCKCLGHTKKYIKDQINDLGLKTVDDVINTLKTGSVCGSCISSEGGIKDILDEVNGIVSNKTEDKELSPYQVMKQIEKIVKDEIAPSLEKDGGNIEIVNIDGYNLYFKLRGACSSCAGASNTIKYVIENKLKEKVSPKVQVFRE